MYLTELKWEPFVTPSRLLLTFHQTAKQIHNLLKSENVLFLTYQTVLQYCYKMKLHLEGHCPQAPYKTYSFVHKITAAAKSLQSCPTLCNPIDGSPPGSTVPRILQARTLEWVAISFSNAWKWKVKVKSLSQSCPTLSDPRDCSLPGSSVHGIFQARVLEWGAIAKQTIWSRRTNQWSWR